jgi:hypothetical protein
VPRHLRPEASRRSVHAHARGADRQEVGRRLVGHLHAVANQISDARIRAFRGTKLLVNQHFLGQATE